MQLITTITITSHNNNNHHRERQILELLLSSGKISL